MSGILWGPFLAVTSESSHISGELPDRRQVPLTRPAFKLRPTPNDM